MYIKSLTVDNKKFIFSSKSTIIRSKGNSVGKTTLLRMILFSLGYQIPATKGLNFQKMTFRLIFSRDDCDYEIIRNGLGITIIDKDNDSMQEFNVNVNQDEILSLVYGLDEPKLLKNILALHYFDQEKGWTLLNRGKIIGSISFSIEEFIEGLSNTEMTDLRDRLSVLLKEQKTYKQFRILLENRKEFESNISVSSWTSVDQIQDEIRSIEMEIRKIQNELQQYRKVKKNNNEAVKLIENMGLRIKTENGHIETIKRDNIVGFNVNQELVSTQIIRQKHYLDSLSFKRAKLIRELNNKTSLIDIDSQLARFNSAVSKLNVSVENLNAILKDYKKNIKNIREKIKVILNKTKISDALYRRILEYTKNLGIDEEIDPYADFIFTSNLKRYSGAHLHLLVFAFRLALLKELQVRFHKTWPIILDSPMSGELDRQNAKKMFGLLSKEFGDNQVIVATIFDLSAEFTWGKIIQLHGRLLD